MILEILASVTKPDIPCTGQYYNITTKKCTTCPDHTTSPGLSDTCCPTSLVHSSSLTSCEQCSRGWVARDGRCAACPEGHTTYPEESLTTCVGPRLTMSLSGGSWEWAVAVGQVERAPRNREFSRWSAVGDWRLWKGARWVTSRGVVMENYTSGYRAERTIRKR